MKSLGILMNQSISINHVIPFPILSGILTCFVLSLYRLYLNV